MTAFDTIRLRVGGSPHDPIVQTALDGDTSLPARVGRKSKPGMPQADPAFGEPARCATATRRVRSADLVQWQDEPGGGSSARA